YLVGAPSHPQQSSPVRGLKLFDGRRVGESRLWEVPRVKQRDRRPLNLGQPTNIRLARRFDEIGSCHVMSLGLTRALACAGRFPPAPVLRSAARPASASGLLGTFSSLAACSMKSGRSCNLTCSASRARLGTNPRLGLRLNSGARLHMSLYPS